MFKNLLFTFFLLFSAFITIYPSKKENTNLFNYCYSLEKIISRNSVEKNKNLSNNLQTFAKDITLYGTNNTKGDLAKKIIDQYKTSKKIFILSNLPSQYYCFAGYWTEMIKPGIFISIFYDKSKQKINEYKVIKKEVDKFMKESKDIKKEVDKFMKDNKDIKKEVDKFMKDINSEYQSIKKEIYEFF